MGMFAAELHIRPWETVELLSVEEFRILIDYCDQLIEQSKQRR